MRSSLDEVRYKDENAKRRMEFESKLEALSHKYTGLKSCILNSIWSAAERLHEMIGQSPIDESRYEFELVIISDMIEECESSVIGRVSLNTRDRSEGIALARRLDSGPVAPDLSNARITIILPATTDSASNPRRAMSFYDIREFWRVVFRHCGIKEDWFWDNSHIQWVSDGELPNRLKRTG